MKKLYDIEANPKNIDPAIAITLKFVLAGIIWIVFSDSLVSKLNPDNFLFNFSHIHILKGILFVSVMGAFIFSVLHDFSTALRAKESELQQFFKLNPNAMAIMDASTYRFTDVNESALRLFGYSQSDFVSRKLTDLVAREDADKFQSVLLFIKTGYDNLDIWTFAKNDGTLFGTELTAKPIGSKKLFLICFRDITNHLRVEQELNKTSNSLEDQIARRTEHYERVNEELAYRASQTEHVNAELILVNEQLLNVNRRIAGEALEQKKIISRIHHIWSQLNTVTWSFDLSNNEILYSSPGLEKFFGVTGINPHDPWFWVDCIAEKEERSKEMIKSVVELNKCSSGIYQLADNGFKSIYISIRISRDESGKSYLSASACELNHTTLKDDPASKSIKQYPS